MAKIDRYYRVNGFREVLPDQVETLLGRDLAYKYLMQHNYRLYQARNGDYIYEPIDYRPEIVHTANYIYNQDAIIRLMHELYDEEV